MFGARASLVVGSDFDARAVVFENTALDMWCGRVNRKAPPLEFFKKVHDVDDVAESGREGDVFRLGGGESAKRLEFGGADDRAAGVGHDKAREGQYGAWVVR